MYYFFEIFKNKICQDSIGRTEIGVRLLQNKTPGYLAGKNKIK